VKFSNIPFAKKGKGEEEWEVELSQRQQISRIKGKPACDALKQEGRLCKGTKIWFPMAPKQKIKVRNSPVNYERYSSDS